MEIATNVKLNPLYIVDRQDEIEFVHRGSNGYQFDFESGWRVKTTATWNYQNAARVR